MSKIVSLYQPTDFIVHLADDALILGHRNSEWTGHGPILEQDIALSNISLDLIGQARNFYQYAAKLYSVSGKPVVTEDILAYHRDAWDFKNCLLVEQSNGDWAKTILRQFLVSQYQFLLYESLLQSKDATISAISEKALKEVSYHLRWSSEWVIRLGDGTEESHKRMLNAVSELWMFVPELFTKTNYEKEAEANGIGTDISSFKPKWLQKVNDIFREATLSSVVLDSEEWHTLSGKEGRHTEHLGYLLAEMQFMQRAYPGCEW